MRRINLERLEITYGDDDPDGYRVGHARFGPLIGASAMGATVYELQLAVAVYPDSDKIGVFPPEEQDKIMVRRGSAVDYFDGEL